MEAMLLLTHVLPQPTSFMQNINVQKVVESGVIVNEYATNVLQGFLDLNDLAEVTANIILDPVPHNLARYELTGENLTVEEVAGVFSAHLGKTVKAVKPPREATGKAMAHVNVSNEFGIDALDRMLYYYDRR